MDDVTNPIGLANLRRRQFLTGLAGTIFIPSLAGAAGLRQPIVDTSAGKLSGVQNGRSLAFRGIAYADATNGKNRFMAPQPVKRWTGVRAAAVVGDRCPQNPVAEFNIPGNWFGWYADTSPMGENCCRLNVFTPGLDRAARRPVMVYLHGGGFRSGGGGSPSLDGSKLAEFGDVVVVTINHRINVFGYVNLGHFHSDFADAANVGQLDIVAALKWVRENISQFGGDPNNVLIFGQSGGGSKIIALMGMPAAKGLFHKAINMSGSSGYGVGPVEERSALAEEYLKQLGVASSDVHRLQDIPADQLVQAHTRAAARLGTDDFRPSVDGKHIPFPLLSDQSLALHTDVPLMMGTTRTEGSPWLKDPRNRAVNMNDVISRVARQFDLGEAEARTVIAAYQDEDPKRSAYDILVAIASDTVMRVRMLVGAEHKIVHGRAPVGVYSFERDMPADGGMWGSPHTCDIPFAFQTIDIARAMIGPGAEPQHIANSYAGAYVAFARNSELRAPSATRWQRYDVKRRPTMLFNTTCNQVDDYHGATRRIATSLVGQAVYRITSGPLIRLPAA